MLAIRLALDNAPPSPPSAFALSLALVDTPPLDLIVPSPTRQPIAPELPARAPANPLVLARRRSGCEPLPTLAAPMLRHACSVAQQPGEIPWVGHDGAAPAARSNAGVDHDRAAGWVTPKAPLK